MLDRLEDDELLAVDGVRVERARSDRTDHERGRRPAEVVEQDRLQLHLDAGRHGRLGLFRGCQIDR